MEGAYDRMNTDSFSFVSVYAYTFYELSFYAISTWSYACRHMGIYAIREWMNCLNRIQLKLHISLIQPFHFFSFSLVSLHHFMLVATPSFSNPSFSLDSITTFIHSQLLLRDALVCSPMNVGVLQISFSDTELFSLYRISEYLLYP